LLASIDGEELTDWLAYYQVEPWDETRADLRNALLMALVANINRRKGARAFSPTEFMLDFDREESREAGTMDSEAIEAVFRAFAAASQQQTPTIVGPDGRPAHQS
jgi:hypothetical protein